MLRNKTRWMFISIILGTILTVSTACSSGAVQTPLLEDQQRTIRMSGTGVVSAPPDQVVLRLGVETSAETAQAALQQNNEQMTAVIESLKEAGIAAEDIQTRTIRLNPQYDSSPQEPGQGPDRQLLGYTASNTVEARSGDLDQVGELFDAAVEAGANQIDGLTFEVQDPQDLLAEARERAWENAQAKAEQMASLSGAELGDVLTITESTGAPRPYGLGGVEMEAAQEAVPIERGTQNFQVELQVTWLLQE